MAQIDSEIRRTHPPNEGYEYIDQSFKKLQNYFNLLGSPVWKNFL